MVAEGFPTSFNFKGVLLDIDNTLYKYDPCHEFAIKKCYEHFTEKVAKLSFEEFSSLYNSSKKRVHTDLHGQGSSHSRVLYFQKALEITLSKTDFQLTQYFDKLYWNSFFSQMKISESAAFFLKRCHENNVKICAVTDLIAAVQIQKIIYLNISSFFSFLVTSEEAGVEKPDPYIFKLAMEKLKLPAEDVIVIGDSMEKDIKGADNLNIKSHVIRW